jgi:diacylglycerol kinase (ATP)
MVLEAAVERPVPATVFVNPSAGRGGAGRKIAEVRQEFARRQFLVDLVETASSQEFSASVQARMASGCRTFIAMGGDGTLQLLVREVIGRELQVGVIPAGGGNDFAAALGIQKNASQAADVIVAGKSRSVDVVRARTENAHVELYLGGGGLGLDAEAVRYACGKFLRWPGRLRYVASAIAALRGFSGVEIEADFPGSDLPRLKKRVLLAAALNTPTYGGGLRLAPDARLDDGLLEIVMIEMLRKREVLVLLPRLLSTGELRTKKVTSVRAGKVRFMTQGESWFHGDGELLGRAPVEIEVMRSALRVLAP